MNTEAFLRICTPDPVNKQTMFRKFVSIILLAQVIWEKFGWTGKSVHAIITQIAESGVPK